MIELEHYCPGVQAGAPYRMVMPDLAVWFSYGEPVAYQVGRHPLVVQDNTRGVKRARHLDAIDGGGSRAVKQRIPRREFLAALQAVSIALEETER